MINQPLVSIIIPCYNKADFLKETLDSINAQTYINWECIVIDDGSTDNNTEIVYNYSKNDNRFKLFLRKNFDVPKGANACRNIGIEKSKGEYLIFLDGDDWMLPFCIEHRVKFMQDNLKYDMAIFQMEVANDYKIVQPNSKLTKIKEDYLYAFLSHQLPWQTSGPILKKEIVLKVNGFDEDFLRLQDPEFYTKLLLLDSINYIVLNNVKSDILYRVSDHKTVKNSFVINGFNLYILKFKKELELKGMYNKYKPALINSFRYCNNYYFSNLKRNTDIFLFIKFLNNMFLIKIIDIKDFFKIFIKLNLSVLKIKK